MERGFLNGDSALPFPEMRTAPVVLVRGLLGDGGIQDAVAIRARLNEFPILHAPPGLVPVWELGVSIGSTLAKRFLSFFEVSMCLLA